MPDEGLTIKDLIDDLVAHAGTVHDGWEVMDVASRLDHLERLHDQTTRALAALPDYTGSEALNKTRSWLQKAAAEYAGLLADPEPRELADLEKELREWEELDAIDALNEQAWAPGREVDPLEEARIDSLPDAD